MTKLFEASWREGYQFFERYYDTDLKQSVKNEIKVPYEWFEPSSKGLYTAILDDSIKLEKRQGNAKDGRNNYGFLDPMYRNIRDNYWNNDGYNMKPKVLFLDIETRVGTNSNGFPVPEKAKEPISLIQFIDSQNEIVFVLGIREWKHIEDFKPKMDYPVKYIKCDDEVHLIETYNSLFKRLDPLIIYAWNGLGFDYPYIYNRMKRLGMDVNQMSNYGDVKYTESEFQGKLQFKVVADGHFYVDLMDVYKKFVFKPRASYALENIAEIELGETKVNHSEYSAFDDFYTGKYNIPLNPTDEQLNSKIYKEANKGNWDEVKELSHSNFCYYGYKDPLLIKKIDDKLNFTSLMLMISEKMGVQFNDSLGTVKPWSQFIANKSMLNKQILPPRKEYDQPNIVGGYVRAPEKGKHNWIMSEDVDSMYPLLGMCGFNMSPETFIPKYKLPPELRDVVLAYFNDQDEAARLELSPEIWDATSSLLKKHNMSMGINGAVFDNNKQGMIPEMIQDIYKTRKQAKNSMFLYERQKLLIEKVIKNKRGSNE